MARSSLPQFVRIKRKRNQDSLQALLLERPRNKRAKDELYVFRLQRTDNEIVQLESDGDSVLPLLQEFSQHQQNTYILPKELKEDEKLPDEFNEMLNTVLKLDEASSTADTKPLKKRKRRPSDKSKALPGSEAELEYVYDVYYRDKAVHESWEKEKIGYIKFEEDVSGFLNDDNDSQPALSDDEDSNAEDFYQNDYPEDEDAHSTSGESQSSMEVLTERLHQVEAIKDDQPDQFDNIYDDFFDEEGNGPTDFLGQLDEDDGDDFEMDEEETEEYPRQNFFPNEQDDELAKHRDKIFGKLQKMIDEDV